MLPLRICIWFMFGFRVVSTSASENSKLISFVQAIWREQHFDTLLLVRGAPVDSPESAILNNVGAQLMQSMPVPVLRMDESATFHLHQRVSERLLAVVQLNVERSEGLLLEGYTKAVDLLRQTPVVFLLRQLYPDEKYLQRLFEYCWRQKMINVVAFFGDYEASGHFYSYTHFPEYHLERRELNVYSLLPEAIFSQRIHNLMGYELSYILSGSDPRLVVYVQPNGELFVGGSAGHLVRAFAQKHNCTLVQPLPSDVNDLDPSQKSKRYVRNGTVEISAGLTFPEIPFKGCSYPYEHLNLCLLLPVAADVPNYEFFLVVFSWQAFGLTIGLALALTFVLNMALLRDGRLLHPLDLLVHDNCLRGMLAQPFTEIIHPTLVVRFIYLEICVFGILLTTSYNSYFATYFTSPPKQARLSSLDDVRRSGIQVFAWGPEYEEILTRVPALKKYASIFQPEYDYQRYLHMRDSFDSRYIYMVPTIKRTIINQLQQSFATPIFRAPEEVCVYHNIPFCFPVQYNSIYLAALNRLLLDMAEVGLMDYWRQFAFYELISAKKLIFEDLSKKRAYESMRVADLQYIWLGLGIMFALALLAFLTELGYYYRRRLIAITLMYHRVRCPLLNNCS